MTKCNICYKNIENNRYEIIYYNAYGNHREFFHKKCFEKNFIFRLGNKINKVLECIICENHAGWDFVVINGDNFRYYAHINCFNKYWMPSYIKKPNPIKSLKKEKWYESGDSPQLIRYVMDSYERRAWVRYSYNFSDFYRSRLHQDSEDSNTYFRPYRASEWIIDLDESD